MSFMTMPSGDAYHADRIGTVKAVETGFLVTGRNGPDDYLEYSLAPVAVAIAWRDALITVLGGNRRNRPIKQLDWLAIAAAVDRPWAIESGWTPPAEPSVGPTSAVTPLRRAAGPAPAVE